VRSVRSSAGRPSQSARHDAHELQTLLLARAAGPERPEGGDGLVQALALLDGVVVKVEPLALVPEVVVDHVLPPGRAREPLVARLRAARAPLAARARVRRLRDGPGREVELLLELELVVEHLADRGPDVDLVLVEERLEVDRAQVRAPLLEAVRRVVARLAHGAVVEEVLVERGLAQRAVVVPLRELVHGQAVLVRERLEDVREVRRLRLGRDAEPVRAEAREARLGVDARLRDPDGVVLLDGGLDRGAEPAPVRVEVGPVELVVDLEGHVGQERRLRAAEVVGARAVEDLAVVLDLEDEVLDHALGHVHLAVDEQAEGDEVRVPIVELVEARAGDDEGDALERFAAATVVDLVHREREQARLVVEALHERGVVTLGGEDLDVEVEVRPVARDAAVVLGHRGLAGGHVDARVDAPRPVLRVGADDLEPVAVDAAGERVPERVADHAREAVDRVLGQARLVEHDPLPAVVAREGELLEQVREHVRALRGGEV
jgi:hypothetical protein